MNNKGSKLSSTESEIEAWLVLQLAQLLNIDPVQVDVAVPFESYSLDSAAAVTLSGDIQEWLGRNLEPMLLFDYPTIESLAKHLAEKD
jgi:acyl carrier protein